MYLYIIDQHFPFSNHAYQRILSNLHYVTQDTFKDLSNYEIVKITTGQELVNHLNTFDAIRNNYIDRLSLGKVKYHIYNQHIDYIIHHDLDDIFYYLCQTKQIIPEEIIFRICSTNSYKCLQLLIDQGVNINIQNNIGLSLLHEAYCYNSKQCIQLLLESGINVNLQDNDGWTVLYLICWKYNDDDLGIYYLKQLLKYQPNVNLTAYRGNSPLHMASCRNKLIFVQLLLMAKADKNLTNIKGLTPLDSAKEYNDCFEQLAELLK